MCYSTFFTPFYTSKHTLSPFPVFLINAWLNFGDLWLDNLISHSNKSFIVYTVVIVPFFIIMVLCYNLILEALLRPWC
jgi:hypothetical protein